MRYNRMTDKEKTIADSAIVILSEPMRHDIRGELKRYVHYAEKLWLLDEEELYALESVIHSTMKNNDLCYVAVTNFLDHPESRLNKFVRYER